MLARRRGGAPSIDTGVLIQHGYHPQCCAHRHHQSFPRVAGDGRRYEHAVFESSVPMMTLHDRMIGRDKLLARLKLKNEETGAETEERTEVVEVDLAA